MMQLLPIESTKNEQLLFYQAELMEEWSFYLTTRHKIDSSWNTKNSLP